MIRNWLYKYRAWSVPKSTDSKLEAEENQCVRSSTLSPKTQEPGGFIVWVSVQKSAGLRPKLLFQAESEGWKGQCPNSQSGRRNPSYPSFLLYSGLHLIGWGPPTIERAICFTQSTDSNVNLIQKHPSRPTVNIVELNMRVRQPMTLLRHESNHHITWHLS